MNILHTNADLEVFDTCVHNFSDPVEVRSIVISVSVCLFVCLFVCLSVCLSVWVSVYEHISKTTHPNFTNFCVRCLWPWLWRLYDTLCTSGFVDGVTWLDAVTAVSCMLTALLRGIGCVLSYTTAGTKTRRVPSVRGAEVPSSAYTDPEIKRSKVKVTGLWSVPPAASVGRPIILYYITLHYEIFNVA